MRTLIFLYGPEKSGGRNHFVLAGAKCVAGLAHTVDRFVSMDAGSTRPGIMRPQFRERGGERVAGELWEVGIAQLERLDQLHGVERDWFIREQITVWLGSGEAGGTDVSAACYLLAYRPGSRERARKSYYGRNPIRRPQHRQQNPFERG